MRTHKHDPNATVIRTPACEFAALRWGDEGPLLMLVHGFPDTPHTWDLVGPRLAAAGFRVVAPYTRGYAPSSIPADGRYDSDTLGTDLVHILDALGEESAIFVGHDYGASAVYSAAGLFPERVSKLVAVAIPHPASIRPTPGLLWGARHFVSFKLPGAVSKFSRNDFAMIRTLYERWSPDFEWPDSEFEAAKNSFAAPGCANAVLGYYRALSPVPPDGHRKRIGVPTLIIGGTTDGVATEAMFRASVSRFTGPVEVEMVPGGHFLHREHPEPFIDALLSFLAAR